MKKYQKKELFHLGFELTLMVKAVDGLLEILGGLLFLFISPLRLNSIISFLTLHELSEDPKDILANAFVALGHSFSVNTQVFVVTYLIFHGVTKLFIVFFLQKKKIWAYPLSIGFLSLFIFYQIYRYMIEHSLFMIFLTGFDILMIWLVWKEYHSIKSNNTLSS